ncbi:MAG: hypothetical protein Q4B45_05405 [Coriobacteriia bacterium]|nr:hypothetical protein [Coriobacteriia bacterium]
MARRASAAGSASKNGKKGSGFSASRLFDIASSGKEALDSMDGEVRIRVHVGAGCDRALALAAKEAFSAERPGGFVEVMWMEAPAATSADPDAAVLIGGPSEPGAGPLARFYLACGVPCAFVCESALDAPDLALDDASRRLYGVVAASSPAALAPNLAPWLARHVGNPIALAANFAFCRGAVVSRLASACAAENAAIGAIPLFPGSDFPVMCASQAKLALDIAAAYGNGLAPSRAVELAGVVGAGLAYRGVARAVAGVVPGLGWALRAGMGYAGTMATAKAVQGRFEAFSRGGAEKPAGPAPAAGSVPALSGPAGAPPEADAADKGGYLVIPRAEGGDLEG